VVSLTVTASGVNLWQYDRRIGQNAGRTLWNRATKRD
jgi:hypothetical protein